MSVAQSRVSARIAAVVNEFYASSDPARQAELDRALTQIRTSGEAFEASFELLDFENPTAVQHFGASVLYDTIRERWEECIAREDIASRLKRTLIEKLTVGAHFQNQSVTNKLSSSLALFALYCVPDVWADPVHDLTVLWAAQPELLLRVLAELAAEFPRVKMPLKQRSFLKSALRKTAEDVIKVVELVLGTDDASPSLRNAAVECVEQWLRLPAADLLAWQSVLAPLFSGALNDFAALGRILSVVSSHDDLLSFENFTTDLCACICASICPMIGSNLLALSGSGDALGKQCECADIEDVSSLVVAVASFTEIAVRPLILASAKRKEFEDFQLLLSLCEFFSTLSTWPGRFLLDEEISDAPESFWNILKEEIVSPPSGVQESIRIKLLELCRPFYAVLLRSAVDKLAYLPAGQYSKLLDKEQMEKFENYRVTRADTSVNAFSIVGKETFAFLNEKLREAIASKSLCSAEAVLFLLERMADYLSDGDVPAMQDTLRQCSELQSWNVSAGVDEARLGSTLMALLYSLSHLICTCNESAELEGICISLVLVFLRNPDVEEEALKTLEKFTEDRSPTVLMRASELTARCYEYFLDARHPRSLRLRAMKCLGYSLSVRDSAFILESLNSILAPRLRTLESILQGRLPKLSLSVENLEEECLFELGVFSALISSLRLASEASEAPMESSAVFLVVRQCLPLFNGLVRSFSTSQVLVEKVCDALRSGLAAVGEKAAAFVDIYFDIIESILLRHAAPACALAKCLILVFSSNEEVSSKIPFKLKNWFDGIYSSCGDEVAEEYIELAYHFVKKSWNIMKLDRASSAAALKTIISLAVKVLPSSQDPSLCRKSAVLLSCIIKNFSEEEEGYEDVLQSVGHCVLSVSFARLQSETMKSTTEALADILMLFARKFPTETREVLSKLPNGSSPAVAAFLKEAHSPRNFRQLVLRFNVQRRKEAKA